jgi:hypothetical protein
MLGRMAAVRCPREYAPLMRRAGALWEPGSRRCCIEPRQIRPVLRALLRGTDPLFRQAGISLDPVVTGGGLRNRRASGRSPGGRHQRSYQAGADTAVALGYLRGAFGLANENAVIRRALALAP